MPNLTVTAVLDDALMNIQDNSPTMRTRFLNWLNNAVQDLALERDWVCLRVSIDLPVVNNSITKPDDFGRVVEIKNTSADPVSWCATAQHKLSDVNSAIQRNRNMFGNSITWTEDPTKITFSGSPPASTVTLVYIPEITNYVEIQSLPFPQSFGNYFNRSLLSTYYEFDMDERAGSSYAALEKNLKALKHAENQLINARAGWSKDFGLVNTDAR
jgi:hypothetical protein